MYVLAVVVCAHPLATRAGYFLLRACSGRSMVKSSIQKSIEENSDDKKNQYILPSVRKHL